MKTQTLSALLLPALFAAAACDAQVGEVYLGEVMLQLSGKVRTENAAQNEYEPVLLFQSQEDSTYYKYLVRGDVRGVFPSDFVFSVTEPPPDQALWQGIALGYVAIAPKNSHSRMPVLEQSSFSLDDCDTYSTDECTLTETTCNAGGECYERDLTCTFSPCKTLETSGDPAAKEVVSTDTSYYEPIKNQWHNCAVDTCLVALTHCGLNSCYSEILECPMDTSEWAAERSCRVDAERGDRSIAEGYPTPTASNYLVVYVTEDALAQLQQLVDTSEASEEAGRLRVGYNLFAGKAPAMEDWLESVRCHQQARIHALEDYNAEHGTSHSPGEYLLPEAVRSAVLELEQKITAACPLPALTTLVDESESAAVNIHLGPPPKAGF